jgi:3-oxoacyl-[acyl-carrier-protein] synthase II
LSVVGLGAVSPFGWGVGALLAGFAQSQPGPRLHREEPAAPHGFWFGDIPPITDSAVAAVFSEALAYSVGEAVEDARVRGWAPGRRVALVHATAKGDLAGHRLRRSARGRQAYVSALPSTPLVELASRHRFTGPVITVGASCAGGLGAVSVARALLETGDATDVVVAATDVGADFDDIHEMSLLETLIFDAEPWTACRPFCDGSRGFVMSEGSAAMVLTSRPATAYARLLSSVIRNDAFHATSIEPSHAVLVGAVEDALAAACLEPADIDVFVAHGSGTAQCNNAERRVLELLTPTVAYALKPHLGHCLGAASLLESVVINHALEAAELRLPPAYHAVLAGEENLPVVSHDGPVVQLALGFGGNVVVGLFGRDVAGGPQL